MKQQPWAKDERKSFWAFDYSDQIFTEQNTPDVQKLAGFITQVWYEGQQIGVVESMLTMNEMFPELYEDQEEQWSFFVTDSGQLCYGTADRAMAEELTAELFGTQAAQKETASTGNVQAEKETVSTAKAQAGNDRAGETAATADTAEIATQYIRMNRRHLVISDLPLAELGGTLIGVNDITEEIHNVYRMRHGQYAAFETAGKFHEKSNP